MRLLLDTHTLIWAVDRPSLLGQDAKVVLENTDQALMLSAATLWETAIKVGLNKLILSIPYRQWMMQAITVSVHLPLPVTADFPPWVGYGTL